MPSVRMVPPAVVARQPYSSCGFPIRPVAAAMHSGRQTVRLKGHHGAFLSFFRLLTNLGNA